ncbi:MAG: formate--tetrahydrofolate ligase, partial [Clostridia bacterium]|nr:formate--tetrahydrofolate ligase [Clostridia bacterium]
MTAKTDIEIAQAAHMRHICRIAATAGIPEMYLEQYGSYKAKVDLRFLQDLKDRPDGKLILVTAISPTPAGEGKTTTSIGLVDGLRRLGKKALITLREPSLGPIFGMKGGAAGGGFAQVLPMEDINLHFTGDFHAIGAANNLLAALTANHIFQGNELGLDVNRVTIRRCLDLNDRQLRNIAGGLGGRGNGVPYEDGFDITAASEVMAILCLAADIPDLKARLGRMIVGYTRSDQPVTAHDLLAEGAMAALLSHAVKPNLVQTLEGAPALIHCGPFANIAHGCNSLIATRLAMKLGDYAVTEAGFGADLGAEKFVDIKCRVGGFEPSAVVIVASVRALKHHGGARPEELNRENLAALRAGLPNLLQHVENIRQVFNLPCVVALNRFPTDSEAELALIDEECRSLGVNMALSEVWAKGGAGGEELAAQVIRLCEEPSACRFCYEESDSIEKKITAIATRIYRADGVEFSERAQKQLALLNKLGYDKLPICMAKTQYSFSDDAKKLGAPRGFSITVRNLRLSAGAGFIVAI